MHGIPGEIPQHNTKNIKLMDIVHRLQQIMVNENLTPDELVGWICPYISRHLLSLNPLLACCRRYSRGER
ncbi:hypothetical protein V3955_004621 [Escherichia coli]